MDYDIELAKEEYALCESVSSTNYESCTEDWDFVHGIGQWDDRDISARQTQGRPALVLNQLLPYLNQVVNDIRQSRLAIRVSPVDDNADIDTAEIFQGIIRNIERQSDAQSVYSTAAMNACGAGIGWIRISTEYSDPMSFDQEIKIDRVLDFTSVYLDPNSEELDGSDAEFGFIRVDYTKDRFQELWPDREPTSFTDKGDKHDGENICVVEYFKKYYEKSKLYRIRLIDGSIQTIDKDEKTIIDDNGTVVYEILDERNTEFPYIKHCVLNGEDVPLSEEDFPCDYIPLIPVIGNEVYIDNERQFHSLIRQAKDAQRMFNYWKSASTEFIALQPKAPWMGALGSFNSHPDEWANSNTSNVTTLEYDLVYDESGMLVAPPQRAMPIQGSPAMMQEAMGAKEDIRLAIGMPQANMGERGNEVSGIAIRNRQIEGDNATFHFVDNLSTSIAHVGRILVDMIPRLYSERNVARILGEAGDDERNVPINTPFVKDQETGNERPTRQGEQAQGIYDLGAGKYDVVCDVGASYSSKRQETADKLIELIRAQPELLDVTGDLLFDALDLPLGKEIADRIRTNMNPAMLGDDPQAAKLQEAAQALGAMQEQLKNYEAALQEKQDNTAFDQNIKMKELELDREKLAVDAQKTAAEIEKMRAETKGFNMDAVAALGNAVNGLMADFSDVREAMEIMLDAKEAEANGVTGEPLESPVQPMEGALNE